MTNSSVDARARRDAHIKRTGLNSCAGQLLLVGAFIYMSPYAPLRLGLELAILTLNLLRLYVCLPAVPLRRTAFGRTVDVYAALVAFASFGWMALLLGLAPLHAQDSQQTVFTLLAMTGLGATGSGALALTPRTFLTQVLVIIVVPSLAMILGPDRLVDWHYVPYCMLVYAAYLLRQSREYRHVLEELIQAEVRAGHEREQLNVLLNASPDAVLSVDRDLRCVAVNETFAELFGLTLADLADGPLDGRLPAVLLENVATFASSDLQGDSTEITFAGRCDVRRYAIAMRKVDNPHIFAIFIIQDIEDERRAEAALLDQQAIVQNSSKLVALGAMAGGIAHEINNPLAIISGRIQALRHQIDTETIDRNTLNKHFDTVVRTVERIATIIRGLRQISRDGTKDPLEAKSVRGIVDDFLPLVEKYVATNHIEVRLDVDPQLTISCRAVEISQVLLNLVSNATDELLKLPAPRWIEIAARPANDWIVISVTDSGAGIPAPLREQIMRPFFTTKGVGQGTGIGLSISRGIAEAHGGRLELDVTFPHTRFNVYLPRAAHSAAS